MRLLLNIIIISLVTIGVCRSGVSNINTGPTVLIETAVLEIKTNNDLDEAFFKVALFNQSQQVLEFTTKSDVEMIQIFNAQGELTFQLPTMSNYITISKSMFSPGNSELVFLCSDNLESIRTSVLIK